MKSKKETTKIKSNSSSSIRKLSMNKEQYPKHKPISKSWTYAKNQGEKTQNQVEMSSKLKNPYLWLKEFEQKICNNGVWKWEYGVFGKEIVEREDEQSQKFEGKLKMI